MGNSMGSRVVVDRTRYPYPRVRIWEWLNCAPVCITLEAGKPLTWYQSRRHDEGWSSDEYTWLYLPFPSNPDRGEIYLEWVGDGHDCDGRHTSRRQSVCAVAGGVVAEGTFSLDDDVVYPCWKSGGGSERDYTAESMGY